MDVLLEGWLKSGSRMGKTNRGSTFTGLSKILLQTQISLLSRSYVMFYFNDNTSDSKLNIIE